MANDTMHRQQQDLHLRAAFAPATINVEQRTVELLWSTGAQVRRNDWSRGDYIEELSMAPGHVRLDRLNRGAPLLDSHDAFSLRSQIGVVISAWIAGNEGRAVVKFSARPEVEPIFRDVVAGIYRNVSVGYKVHRTERDESGPVPIERAVDWEPYELSLVPIPADAGAQVRSEKNNTGGNMSTETISNTDNLDIRAEERRRTTGILDCARKLQVSEALAHQLIADGVALGEARLQLIDAQAAEQRKTPAIARSYEPAYEPKRSAAALAEKLGPCFKGTSNRSTVRVLEDWLVETGQLSRHDSLSAAEIVSRAWSTSDFQLAAQAVGEREVLNAYQAAQNGLIAAAARKTLSDFRPFSGVRFSQLGALPGKKEGGEYKTTGFSEELGYELIPGEYGTVIPLTRKLFINDDLGMQNRLLVEAGRAGAETDRDLLATALGTITWTAKNSTSVSTLGIDALGAGVLLLRRQIDAEKRPVSFEPDLILAAPEHELVLRQLMADYQPAAAGDVQPFSNLRLEIDHRLTAGAIFMIDTRYQPLIIGSIGDPVVSTSEDFKTGNLLIRVQHDAGAAVVDTRSIAKVSITGA
jgi:hypothetical protein